MRNSPRLPSVALVVSLPAGTEVASANAAWPALARPLPASDAVHGSVTLSACQAPSSEAHVTTAADGRISIEPPVAAPARGRVAQSLRDNNQPITRPTPATAPRVA